MGLGVGAGLGIGGAGLPGGAPPVALAPALGEPPGLPPYLPPGRPDLRPATYLLQQAGERLFAALLARLDPATAYRPYFALNLGGPSPRLEHQVWDWVDMSGRLVDAFGRLRLLTGTTGGQAEEAAVRTLLLARQGPEGLLWNGLSPENGGYASEAVEIFSQSRGLLGLTTWYGLTGSARLEAALEAAVAGIDAIAVHEQDTARNPGTQWRGGWLDYTNTPEEAPEGRAKWGLGALVSLPLMSYHALSGSRAARKLADALLAYFVDRSGLVAPSGEFHGHVHAEGYAGLATAAVYQARVAGRDDRLAWAERVYRWIRAHATDHGWFPDAMELPPRHYWYWYGVPWLPPTCESCALTDTLELAIALARSGYPQYWDDVERFARNHLLASQFPDPGGYLSPAAQDTAGARALGGSFASASLPNTLLGYLLTQTEPLIEGCCSGSGARALHLAGEHAVEDRPDGLYVHLGFSTTRRAAEVLSYEPYEGRREVRLAAARRVLVRLPDHARRDEAELWVDDARREPVWRGSYADAGACGPGQVVVLRYPLRPRTEQAEASHQAVTAEWRGGTVLAVAPPGAGPLPYRGAALPGQPTPWQTAPPYPRLTTPLWLFA
jgi:hypothetical protein